jgi:Putative Actinobacterial Holin-X, holin superfamily III
MTRAEGETAGLSKERSFSQLLGDSISETTQLFQTELALFRAEFSDKIGLAGSAVKYLAVGAILAVPAIVMILFAVAAELIVLGLSEPLAYLITGVAAALIAAIFAWIGAARLSPRSIVPAATLREVRKDKELATELAR